MAKTTVPRTSDWREGFLFVGNHPTLDFLNTRPIQDGSPLELLPDFGAVLRWFQAARQISSRQAEALRERWGRSARAGSFTTEMLDFRERLRKEVLLWEHTGNLHRGMVDELNALLGLHPMLVRLKRDAGGTRTEPWFDPREPEDLFAPLAHSAAMLFAVGDTSRVRICANCVLHFLDTSKKGTRRWCSMQLCGNRLKVAAYAARQRRASCG
jgi:predicted RNA-binding Zn ribbon-like protein